ncbi:MAG: potassium-transporting ATPase subunit KdpC [Bacteroidetes bacterium]|nr:potassium-transporting ATPase subunit KdpC [Bacteroidota bacterium]
MLLKPLRPALVLLIIMTILTGIIYPFIITGLAQLCFPAKANGSFMINKGKVIGSELIGQKFISPKYFWTRLSATSPLPYNATASTGSNYGPLNPALLKAVTKRIDDLKGMDSLNNKPIPVDLVTSSSSGLDPHISVASAQYQVPRIARSRGIGEKQIQLLIEKYTEGRTLGILGEPRVNVLKLNYALDEFK